MPEAAAAAAFDALAAEFFPVWFRFHPEAAAAAGVPGYAGLPPAQGDDEVAALGSWLEALVVALEELDYQGLDPGRQIDLRLMFGAARAEHQTLLEQDWRHRDPSCFLPMEGLYRLVTGAGEAAPDRLVALLGGLPDYLRLALGHLRTVPGLICPLLIEAAVAEADGARCYLRELASSPWLRRQAGGRPSPIEGLVDGACAALGRYAQGLRTGLAPQAGAPPGCGERQFRLLLRHRHFLDLDVGRTRAYLTALAERTAAELDALTARMALPVAEVRAPVDGATPPPVSRLENCRLEAERLRLFLTEAALLPLPEAPLNLRERLPCPRPPRLESDYLAGEDAGTLYLAISPDEPLAALRARVRRGTWGGAHLRAFAGGAQARRLPRRVCAGASLELAWGLYLDDRLTLAGYLSPEDRLYALGQRLEALRLGRLDLDLHLGCAAQRELAAVPRRELVSLLRRPADALAGVLGWDALTRARDRCESADPRAFDQRAFHGRLLAQGRIPVPLILERVLGPEGWNAIAAPWSSSGPTTVEITARWA